LEQGPRNLLCRLLHHLHTPLPLPNPPLDFPLLSPPPLLHSPFENPPLDCPLQVSGSKFYYLRNAAALLELALVNWAVTRVTSRGFTPLITPDLVKEAVLEKCGFQPRADNTQVGAALLECWRCRGWGRGEGED
jgi:hypothetical protein